MVQMSTALFQGLLAFSLLVSATAFELQFPRCNCEDNGIWSVESILQCQKVSDFMIAMAYFSIPLEILFFGTCSDLFPFKWVLFQFSAFIVLCGLTHMINVLTYEPHSFLVMLSLTVSKFLTALVSFATAVTLLTLIPQLLRVKLRENFLRIKAHELDQKVVIMKRQEETRWHVRMLTHEIRKSLDRHTILYTTLVELSKTLELQNCVVWMPNEANTAMSLTHELRRENSLKMYGLSISIDDPCVVEIRRSEGANVLKAESTLRTVSSGGMGESGAVAAIRMPMLEASNFKWGTPQAMHTKYAILVLVLPKDDLRVWSSHELEIVKVVADQVAVALSHAAVLEESQSMRDKLEEQNRALLQAKQDAVMASEARNSFQVVMSQGMRRPIHSVSGLLSMLQQERLGPEQRLVVDTMVKTASVVSTLINDVMEISTINKESFSLEMRPFGLHSMIKEASSAIRCLCDSRGFGFGIQVQKSIPDVVFGDEKRIFHMILHIVDNMLSKYSKGFVTFRVRSDHELEDKKDPMRLQWKSNAYSRLKFEIGVRSSQNLDSSSLVQLARKPNSGRSSIGLSFHMCKKLVQLMQGNICVLPNSEGLAGTTTILVLQFQLHSSNPASQPVVPSEQHHAIPPISLLKGLRVLLADDDDINRAVTRILLEKLGCRVTAVSSGLKCLSSLGLASDTPFQLVILGLHMPEMDGFEIAVRIRRLRSEGWPLIVALTTSNEKDAWERCQQAGMNGLIQKPVVLQVLGDELYRVLKDAQK